MQHDHQDCVDCGAPTPERYCRGCRARQEVLAERIETRLTERLQAMGYAKDNRRGRSTFRLNLTRPRRWGDKDPQQGAF
jgi:hypothetical protein